MLDIDRQIAYTTLVVWEIKEIEKMKKTTRGYWLFADVVSPLSERKERRFLKFLTKEERKAWADANKGANPVYANAEQVRKLTGR